MNNFPQENLYGHTKKLRFIIEQIDGYMLQHNRPITLLDFGCGNGSAVSRFLIREGIRYFGVDMHAPSLEYARTHYGGEDAAFLEMVPDGIVFDVIVYSDSLEHLSDPVAVLRSHRRLISEAGLIIGAVPNGFGPFELEKRVDRWLGLSLAVQTAVRLRRKIAGTRVSDSQAVPYNMDSGHLQFFTKKDLTLRLRQGGFQLKDFTNGTFLGAPFSEVILLRGNTIARINSRIADYLPYWAVSSWYFTAVPVSG
ncbi:MAG: class I SAM-dependent methyltransferase [Nitrospirota bacterium]|nr:class I SAM-dependent methyltransferase [Nitrospirota bacterium]